MKWLPVTLLAACLITGVNCSVGRAQESDQPAARGTDESDAKPEAQATAKPKEPTLDLLEQALLGRFDRLDKEMLQMAEQLRRLDPERSDLLDRARSRSQQERIIGQMRVILEGLSRQDKVYGDLVQRQEALLNSMQSLLELLQSENRLSDIEAERQRIQAILKDVNRLVGREKDVRAETERGGNPERSADQQESVEQDAARLTDRIDKQDAQKRAEESKDGKQTKPQDGEPKAGKPQDGKPQDGKPQDGKPQDGKPQDGKPQDGKPQDGQPQDGQPQDGQPQDGKPQDGQPSQGQQSQQQQQEQTPGREDLEQARKAMQRAIDELRSKQNTEKASEHQDEAIRELLEAKDKLEEILRQLREEEKKLMLASLESRFRKMLGLQLLVYQETVQLGAKEAKQEPNLEPRARQLARREEDILLEIDKALVLLREEGSSVAFPQAVEAIREDMESIVELLDDTQVGELTQTVEQSVIDALEEMIDALQEEMQKQEEQQQNQQQQQQGRPQDDPLVDAIAELKMLRSLQLRINRRTKQLGRMLQEGETPDPRVVDQIRRLSDRQERVQRATYDLATGKNR